VFAEQLRPGEICIVSLPTGPATSVPRWLTKLTDKYAKNREVVLRHRTGSVEFEVAPGSGKGQPIRLPVTDQGTVDWLTTAGRTLVSWVVEATPQQIGVQCHAFVAADLGASMTVGIDDGVAEQVRDRHPAAGDGLRADPGLATRGVRASGAARPDYAAVHP
jgi:hypothetical protein